MKVINIKLFNFSELDEKAKETAIEQYRYKLYEYNNFANWVIDDCSLLEPSETELINIFGEKYRFPLIENNRKIYFSLDRDRYIDVSNAMIVNNEYQFLIWLGIPEQMHDKVYFTIGKDTIEFEENDFNYNFNNTENNILEDAVCKFEEHCESILNRIESGIDYRFTDEAIIEDILCNEVEFFEDGSIY